MYAVQLHLSPCTVHEVSTHHGRIKLFIEQLNAWKLDVKMGCNTALIRNIQCLGALIETKHLCLVQTSCSNCDNLGPLRFKSGIMLTLVILDAIHLGAAQTWLRLAPTPTTSSSKMSRGWSLASGFLSMRTNKYV